MLIQELLNTFTKSLVDAYNYSVNTARSYNARITQFLNYKNITTLEEFSNINLTDLEDWLMFLGNELNNGTSSKENKITALNEFYKFLFERKYISENICSGLKRVKIPVEQQSYLDERESKLMVENATDRRSKAIMALCLQCGLRVSEVIKLSVNDLQSKEDFNAETGHNETVWYVVIRQGKGKKDGVAYIDEFTKRILDAYLCVRKDSEYNNLFISDSKKPMIEGSINKTLKTIARRAGIDKNVTVHSLRRSLATRMNDRNEPLTYIQKVLRHSSYVTTLRYIGINETKVRESVTRTSLYR